MRNFSLCILMIVILFSCSASANVEPNNSIRLDKSSISIQVGETERLYALDITYVEGALAWSSSNTAIATVNDYGIVTGISPGTATITVKTRDNKYAAFCMVTVTDKHTENKPDTINAKEVLGANPPIGGIFGNNGELLIYEKLEGLNQEKIILKAEDLLGNWSIKDFSPKSNYGWSASFIYVTNAKTIAEISKIAITFTEEITDSIEVTVESRLGELKLFPIVFAGVNTSNNNSNNNSNWGKTNSNSNGGCNSLFGLSCFALLFVLRLKNK